MIRDKRIGSLLAILTIIQDAAKANREGLGQSVAWEISDFRTAIALGSLRILP